VSAFPDGWRMVNEIVAGPARATRAGAKPSSENVRAGATVGALGRDEDEQPARMTSAQDRSRKRLICRRITTGRRVCQPLP
jgi:hypothetical protein